MSATQPKLPGPDHPITIEPHPGTVVVSAAGREIARSDAALTLQEADYAPVLYLPLSDLDQDVLVESETTSWCPYKGTASYYSLRTEDGISEDAIWYYPTPHEAVAEITGHAAFYADRVTIES